MEYWNVALGTFVIPSPTIPSFHPSTRAFPNTFGARNLAGVAGHARRSKKKTTKERKVVNV